MLHPPPPPHRSPRTICHAGVSSLPKGLIVAAFERLVGRGQQAVRAGRQKKLRKIVENCGKIADPNRHPPGSKGAPQGKLIGRAACGGHVQGGSKGKSLRTANFKNCGKLWKIVDHNPPPDCPALNTGIEIVRLVRESIAFVELGPYAVGARHRFLRTSQALRTLCCNPPPRLEAVRLVSSSRQPARA